MSTLTVGTGQQYSTIAAAVAASASGDTINVNAGTYTNDFLGIYHNLTINGIGTVKLVATAQPPNGKAIIDEGGSGVSVTLNGLDLSGATVSDGNGAGVRYEGGTLVMNNDTVHGNQDGILANADSAGLITISNSNFYGNGAGDGYTHNIYVGAIASLTVQNSTIADAIGGHDIKSRAASTTVTGNLITDKNGSASYEVDITSGGVAVVSNNVIEKGPNATNPIAITYGEEGSTFSTNSLTVSGNTLVNDKAGTTYAIANKSAITASVTNNLFYGWTQQVYGTATTSGNTSLSSEPTLTLPGSTSTGSTSGTTTSGTVTTGTTTTGTTTTGTTATGTITTGTTTTGTTTTGTTTTGTTSSGSASTPVTTRPALPAHAVVNYTDTTKFAVGQAAMVTPGSTTPSYIAAQYIWSSPDSVSMSTVTPNSFLQGSSGRDSLQVASGHNILDGGTGSNFLVGGTGIDTFINDARGGSAVWDTLVHFHAGDTSTLLGFVPGSSTYAWDSTLSGTNGFTGATLRVSTPGQGVTASISFAGYSVAQAQALTVSTGTANGVGFLTLQG